MMTLSPCRERANLSILANPGNYQFFIALYVLESFSNQYGAPVMGTTTHAMHLHGAWSSYESQFGA
jgi:hypothetical protein